ncbi:MAG: phytanoyl-CoA dioxygenase family protein [Acidobacteria bacterium]|nr:phytanoyl-CoA dioxygenase family protein [Acidobacteriota bacterium]
MTGPYRRLKWFRHERLYNWLYFDWLRFAHFSWLFSERGYRWVNRRHIERFSTVYGNYTPSAAEARVLADFQRDGIAFASVSDFFDPEMLTRLQARFDRLIAEKGEAYMSDPTWYSKVLDLNGDLCSDPVIKEWVMSRSFLNIASLYLGLVPRCGAKQEYVVIPTPNEKVGAQLWHRDGSDKKITKVFVYLNDVEEDNGPFRYIKGTHHQGLLRDVLSWTGQYVWGAVERTEAMLDRYKEIFETREVVCTGKAGTIIFADTSGFHRGGHCRSGHRRMIELSYYSNAAFISITPYLIPKSFPVPDDPALRLAFGLD